MPMTTSTIGPAAERDEANALGGGSGVACERSLADIRWFLLRGQCGLLTRPRTGVSYNRMRSVGLVNDAARSQSPPLSQVRGRA